MLSQAIAKAMHNLLLPGIIKLFLWCLIAYAVGWTVLAWILGDILQGLSGTFGLEGAFVQMLGTLGGGMVAWFLFPLLYPILMSFFDDYMAEAIEREDYPQLPAASPPFWPTLAQDALFSLKAIGYNILLLPIMLVPPVYLLAFYILNSYLIGTQFFRMAAGRRSSKEETERLRRQFRNSIVLGGFVVMLSGTVPPLNLVAPVLAVATMLHLYHLAKGHDKQQVLPPS